MKASYKHTPKSETLELKSVNLWTLKGVHKNVDLVIQDGLLKSVTPSQGTPTNRTVVPAGVDTQVHLRVPGQAEKETADSGCLAALHGGVGALLTMPNTKPFIDNVETLHLGQEEVRPLEEEFGIRVLFSACITLNQKGTEIAPLKDLAKAGAVAFTDDGKGVLSEDVMAEAFSILSDLQLPLLQHAEMPGALGPLAPGPVQESLGLKPYLPEIETEMIKRDLHILKKYPRARYHVLHLSAAESVELLKRAKSEGLHVSSEVTPHHLFFSCEDIQTDNKSFKMNPPLRSPKDRDALQKALAHGEIDWMATDHAPHESETKAVNFPTASFGTTGLETSLQVMLWMVQKGYMSITRFIETWTIGPARFLGLEKQFGDLGEGRPFRAVVVDLDQTVRVQEREMWGLSKNSCFVGQELPGRILGHYTANGFFDFTVG
jgi:dihydroorotase